jgi:hypothetical protein
MGILAKQEDNSLTSDGEGPVTIVFLVKGPQGYSPTYCQ